MYLIKATDFIDNVFAWNGIKSSQEQYLEFPRKNLIDRNGYKIEGIPNKLKQAVCVASLMLLDGEDLFITDEANGAVTSETIGSLHFSYDISQNVKDSTLYQQINTLLRGLYRDTTKKSLVIGSMMRV